MRSRLFLAAAVSLAALAAAASVSAQETEFFQEPSGVRVDFKWDFLARYDRISHLLLRPDIVRGRFEFRPEVDLVVSDRFRIGARAVGDLGTDQNSDNTRNFDNYRSTGARLERYFVEGKPGRFRLLAGSFEMPLVASEMLWDHDIQTLGAAAAWELPAGSSTLTFAAGGFRGPQREGDRTRIGAGQVVWRLGDASRFSVEAAASYWSFDPDHLRVTFIRQNYTEPPNEGGPAYVSRFRIGDFLLRFRFPAGRVPVMLSLDGVKNFGSREEAKGDDKALEASVTLGRVGTPGQVRGFYTFQYIQRDALLGAYNTDDWWFHTWYRGHRVGLAVTMFPQVYVQASAMVQQRLDRNTWLNRYMLDLVKMF